MKTASAGLIALLNGGNKFLMADLFTITLFGGTVYRWTSADTDIVLSGHTFSCSKEQGTVVPIITRGQTKSTTGLEVDTLTVTLGGAAVLIGGVVLPLAATNGVFDGAKVQLERVFMPTWGDTSLGSIILFSGFVAGVTPSSTRVQLTVQSDLQRLQVAMPRNTFAPACTHVLFDSGCLADRPTFTFTGTVAAGATVTSVPTSLIQPDAYFNLGVITFTSGALSGLRASVKSYVNASGRIVVAVTLPSAPANGDTFSITPGCDKTTGTCNGTFANLQHFRGFPFVPSPESTRGVGP